MKLNAAPLLYKREDFVEAIYQGLLKRAADTSGMNDWLDRIEAGVPLSEVVNGIAHSEEAISSARYVRHTPANLLEALHAARVEMVRQLPPAKKIVDLGGGAINDPRGGLVVMGYPYFFERLFIIEPPPLMRHEIYKDIPDLLNKVETDRGTVQYMYTSMADLSAIPDQSIDLVFSGETIEHVSPEDCKKTLREVRRILKKDGSFCFDTPNRSVTEIQMPSNYINPDHKIEYRHHEMMALLKEASLKVVEVKGITHMPKTYQSKVFHEDEMRNHIGMYADYESCYMLYYKCVRA
jgi:predicted SAM-dependent methyltransferase